MIPYRLIERKRDGGALSARELSDLFAAYLNGSVPEYQMSAFLMAVYFRGLSGEELDAFVDLMIGSGAQLDLGYLHGPRIDKHSTGGVGDKVSLVLAPLAAELGVYVPMMSGRGLGHTGGTLDKLEAIPGFETDLTLDRFKRILEEIGCAMMGQTPEIAPLDKRLYALRSVTATVPSIPLISASIMSKKLAEGLTGLVLDVKRGAGAFIPEADRSDELAGTMVAIGERRGVPTVALQTAMDRPLGHTVGNGLEVREALTCLAGEGPEDLARVTSALVGEMLALGGLADDAAAGARVAAAALGRGQALERMARLVALQGGDARVVENPASLPEAPYRVVLEADTEGWVRSVEPRALGYGVVSLGGGRRTLDQQIDPRVGFVLHVVPGSRIEEDQPIGEVHAADPDGAEEGLRILRSAIETGSEPGPDGLPMICGRVPDGAGASTCID